MFHLRMTRLAFRSSLGMLGAAMALMLSAAPGAHAETIIGLTTGNQLVRFDSANPNVILGGTGGITGLQIGESILGIDYRPNNGQLYGLGSSNRLYTIDASTGVATAVNAVPFSTLLTGNDFGFDFNPVPDRTRVVSSAEQNLRLNPNTGGVAATDPNLSYATGDVNAGANPNVVGVAYTNSFTPSPRTPPPGTTLYSIDSTLDILAVNSNGAGDPAGSFAVLNTIGALGFNFSGDLGFDISGATGIAYIGGHSPGDAFSKLFTVNLATGAATMVGSVGLPDQGIILRGIAVAPVPEPASLAMAGLGLVAIVALARRRRAARG